jgi:hypothetical protein
MIISAEILLNSNNCIYLIHKNDIVLLPKVVRIEKRPAGKAGRSIKCIYAHVVIKI